MGEDLLARLKAALDEDERVALAAAEAEGDAEWIGRNAMGTHVARWDPARVLRWVAAAREVLERALSYEAKIDGEWGCCHDEEAIAAGRCPDVKPDKIPIVRALARVYGIGEDHG